MAAFGRYELKQQAISQLQSSHSALLDFEN
jgi:hypothetical protein